MPRKRRITPQVDPDLLAKVQAELGGFGRRAAKEGVPLQVYEAQLWDLLARVKEELLAEHRARASSHDLADDGQHGRAQR